MGTKPSWSRTAGSAVAIAVVAVIFVFGAYAAIARLTGATDPSGQGPPAHLAGFTLRYTQEFTGNGIPANWYAYDGTPGGESPSVAQWKPGMCVFSGGVAHFMASGIDSCGMEFDGADQEYGAWFARIKGDDEPDSMTFSDIFLLWPANNSWPPEIDIYEDDGQSRHVTFASMYNTVGDACGRDPSEGCLDHYQQTNRPIGAANNGTQWHTYGVEWTPAGVTWLIDGRAVFTAPASAVQAGARQPSQRMRLVLQSQSLRGVGAPAERETMAVDWVAQFSYDG